MNRRHLIFTICLVIQILFTFTLSIFAENEVQIDLANNIVSNETNEVRPLTLEEQKQQVADAITNANNKLSYVDGEISQTMVEIQTLNDQIATYKANQEKTNADYNTLLSQITQSENEIAALEDSYEKNFSLMEERLVAFYKRGEISYTDVLFSSTDIIDFFSNYFIIQEIAEYDSNTLSNIETSKIQIEKKTAELLTKKEQLKATKEEADTQTVLLTNAQILVQNYMKSLSTSEQQITAEINTYKLQQQEIEGLISNALINSSYEAQYSGGVMLWPTLTTNYITSGYGNRLHPIQGVYKNHDGIDIGGRTGDPVYAADNGYVIYSAVLGGYGKAIMIDHGLTSDGKRLVSLYGHGSNLLKNVGDTVYRGETIMEMGSTGVSTGPHLHFEVREDNISVDPKKYLSSDYVDPSLLNTIQTNSVESN